VIDILQEFKEHVAKMGKQTRHVILLMHSDNLLTGIRNSLRDPDLVLPTIISGLTVYFDRSLGANLLYRFERPQYAEIRKAYVTGPKVQVGQEKDMSSVYGAEHLLRMLGMFSALLDWIAWRGLLTDCSAGSELATDGSQLDDGWGEHRVGERLCERTALVRVCFSLSCLTGWLTNDTASLRLSVIGYSSQSIKVRVYSIRISRGRNLFSPLSLIFLLEGFTVLGTG
jgi:hypothetical protein